MNVKITQSGFSLNFWRLVALAALFGPVRTSAQNSCAAPQAIGPGTYTVAAINGTNVTTTCSTASMAEWFVYTPTADKSVTITSDLAQNICKDTNFSVYTGSCGSLSCYASDDDSGVLVCNSSGSSFLSKKTFDAFAGTTYYIAWDNRWNAQGFDFQLIEAPFMPSPCTTATLITAGTHTVSAVDGANAETLCSNASAGKWFRYVPSQDFLVTITSDLPQNICKDTNFSVYTGSCSSSLTCVASDDNSGILACNSGNANSNLSKRTFEVSAGMTYYIAWDNKWSASGFDFQIIESEIVIPVTFNTQSVPTLNGGDYNICVVDMNGDGKDDIASVSNGTLRIHHQGDAGALTPTVINVPGTSLMPSWSLAAGDYNEDGFTDLLLGNGNGVTFWKSNSSGTAYSSITPGQYIFCQRTNFVDINNDGHLDAFSCHDIAPNCFYLNDGLGNMSFFQSSGSNMFGNVGGNYASIWTDYNNDGAVDLFVSKCSGPPCELHRNNGDGTFTNVASVSGLNFTPVSSWSSAVFDYDNDGDMDILIGSNGSYPTRLYRNDLGSGTPDMFTNVTAGSGWDTETSTNRDYIAYDFDNNGYVDVLGGGGKIMFNQGDGTFIPTNYAGISVGAVGDLNSDGFLDILNGTSVRYGVPNDNNWLTVTTSGNDSNNNGIGARVEITGPWGTQIRDIRSGEGFEYMSTLNAHFGLGTNTEVDQVIVRWPNGEVDVVVEPAANTNLEIVQGSSPLSTPETRSNVFKIYPNPAHDQLTISPNSQMGEIESVQVFDMTGRIVLEPRLNDSSFSVKALSNGTYIVMIRTSDGKSLSQKFLKN